jgi:hypothetical protein
MTEILRLNKVHPTFLVPPAQTTPPARPPATEK